jgi:hypothetical protein
MFFGSFKFLAIRLLVLNVFLSINSSAAAATGSPLVKNNPIFGNHYRLKILQSNSSNESSSLSELARYISQSNGTALLKIHNRAGHRLRVVNSSSFSSAIGQIEPAASSTTRRMAAKSSFKKFTNKKSETTSSLVAKLRDDRGAQFYVIIVVLFYSLFACLVLVIRIKPKKKIRKEDKERERAEHLIRGMQDYLVTKKILEQLSNKEYRDRAWSIYRSNDANNRRDSQFERSLLLKEENIIKNIEKKIEDINRRKSNLKEFEELNQEMTTADDGRKRRFTVSEMDFDEQINDSSGSLRQPASPDENFLKKVSDWRRSSVKMRFTTARTSMKIKSNWRQRSLPGNKKPLQTRQLRLATEGEVSDHYFSVNSPFTAENERNIKALVNERSAAASVIPLGNIFPQLKSEIKECGSSRRRGQAGDGLDEVKQQHVKEQIFEIDERTKGRFRVSTMKSYERVQVNRSKKSVSFDDANDNDRDDDDDDEGEKEEEKFSKMNFV